MNGKNLHLATMAGLAALLCGASLASAQTAPTLGSASSFAVLGGSTVTNTGSTVVTGDVGLSPGSSVTGFPPGVVVSGGIHPGDSAAQSAQTDLTAAYNNLAGQGCTQDLSGQDLGGMILTTGVYCFTSSAQLTGTLTLDAQGNPGAVFIFKIGTSLTTATNSLVSLINSASECNVFWQVGSSATLGTTTSFAGNILALTSITANTGASIAGRALAQNGAVTLDTNSITQTCAAALPTPTPTPTPQTTPTPTATQPPGCPATTVDPATLPNGVVGIPYSQTITGTGGTAPFTFIVTAGVLPPGLTLTPAGVLAGTPTTAGTFTFTIRRTDANLCFAERPYSLLITTAVPTLPEAFLILFVLALTGAGYLRLRRLARAEP